MSIKIIFMKLMTHPILGVFIDLVWSFGDWYSHIFSCNIHLTRTYWSVTTHSTACSCQAPIKEGKVSKYQCHIFKMSCHEFEQQLTTLMHPH